MNTCTIYRSQEGEKEIMSYYDEVLARWPVSKEEYSITTRHGTTFVLASGRKDASPLVLLHGAASNSSAWIGDIEKLSASFRVFAVDALGEAGKSDQNRPVWEGEAFAEWLEDVMDGLNVTRAALLGISQGGRMALKFAVAQPQRVERLVLLTPGGLVHTRTSFMLKGIFYSMFGKWGASRINRLVIGDMEMHPDAIRYMNAILTHFKTRIDKEYIFSDNELRRLDMPVQLISGTLDAVNDTQKMAERLRRVVPQTEIVIQPEVGHAVVNVADIVLPFMV